jgi:glyoxylase-like metal-dependent hydrolase (beta-lactamase superfamily II)/rhodanese-related sulfurtransferase
LKINALDLYRRLQGPEPPLLLDVRNAEEFRRWPVDHPDAAATLNLPYFAFVESEEAAVAKAKEWLGTRRRDLVVVCAKGGSSEYVSEILRGHGLPAINLEDGMVGWGNETDFLPVPAPDPLRVWQAIRFGKGCLSYVVASGSRAIVVDPHRNVSRYLDFLGSQRLELGAVSDTHLHADHLSGAALLSREGGCPYLANPLDFRGATFGFEATRDGGRAPGGFDVAFLHSPGHTPGSTALSIQGCLLLTGDTLFVDSVGRPDLGGEAIAWGRDLFGTLHERWRPLPDDLLVLPAHSAGRAEIGPNGIVGARLGDIRQRNAAFRQDEAAFLGNITAGAGTAPSHYARIRRVNLGLEPASEEDLLALDLGKNECALSRRHA